MMSDAGQLDLFLLEDTIWLATASTQVPAYDFEFSTFFAVRRPWDVPMPVQAIGRFGATSNYIELFKQLQERGIELVHSPEMHVRASELPAWYPLIEDLTPKSRWHSDPPSIQDIEAAFEWPVFLKGSRQTSRHQSALSIVETPQQYTSVVEQLLGDPILHWQDLVVREFVPLRPVGGSIPGKIPASFEFRSFWWRGQCVGAGPYHTQADHYWWTDAERSSALAIADEAAKRVDVTFLVIDLAQRSDGSWIVIELNDGQESGYAGIAPTALWQNIVAAEKACLDSGRIES